MLPIYVYSNGSTATDLGVIMNKQTITLSSSKNTTRSVLRTGTKYLNQTIAAIGYICVMCCVAFYLSHLAAFTPSKLEAVVDALQLKPDFFLLGLVVVLLIVSIVIYQLGRFCKVIVNATRRNSRVMETKP